MTDTAPTDQRLDAAAKAVWSAIWEGDLDDAWDLASDGEKDNARKWAQAAIDALQLTEERQVTDRYCPIPGSPYAGHERYAGKRTWVRFVSPWVVDQQ